MARVVLVLFFVAVAVLAAVAVIWAMDARGGSAAPARGAAIERESGLPRTFRMIAYVLLLMLMLGVATGWLGSA
jgi:hypothetical protein